MIPENRKHPRIQLTSTVKLYWNDAKPVVVNTHDLSDGGAFLKSGHLPVQPPVGDRVSIQLTGKIEGKEPPLVHATVIRSTKDGIALRFEFDD